MSVTVQETENMTLSIRDCGLAEYREILRVQQQLQEKRRQGEIANTVLIVEHPSVITLGARQSANKLLANRDELAQRSIDIVEIRRGGGTTAHNPGQVVFYPILYLPDFGLGISEYVRELEAIGAELLGRLGVQAQRRKGFPGLWVGEKKIASIGVRVSKSVTYHGMAINIDNDLSIFDLLVPCGLDGVEMTSVLKETSICYPMGRVKKILAELLTRACYSAKYFATKHESQRSAASQSSTTHLRPKTTDPRPQSGVLSPESGIRKLPRWLHRPLPAGETYNHTKDILSALGLETICLNANCPNRGECWNRGTATVLILGNVCTRNCGFCSVATGKPAPPDPTEPARVAEMARQMALKYLVITSVDRDDLPDGGAGHFRDCINKVRQKCPAIKFEILTPDLRGCQGLALKILHTSLPFVFAHNIETVPSLYPVARPGGDYQRSLNLLKMAKESYHTIQTKSSIMLGLGETDGEIEQVLEDLRSVGCDRITIGQYLKPSKNSLEVVEYIAPAKFNWWKQKAGSLGFGWVMSSPFTRSSYLAEKENTL